MLSRIRLCLLKSGLRTAISAEPCGSTIDITSYPIVTSRTGVFVVSKSDAIEAEFRNICLVSRNSFVESM